MVHDEVRFVGFILEKAEVEACGFKCIEVELQGSLLHLKEDLKCNLSSNLLSYAVLCFSNNKSQPTSVFALIFC